MKVFSIVLLFLATVVVTSQGAKDPYFSCLSWRFGVETNNIRDWKTVPQHCGKYVENYMVGPERQYSNDSAAVVNEALSYAKYLKLAGDGKDIWVFDIDDTTLSTLPYLAKHGFGTEEYNETAKIEWYAKGEAPVLPETFKLYKNLTSLQIKVVFLTGRSENLTEVTSRNLKKAGYHTWEKLILKSSSYPKHTTAEVYKSNERRKLEENEGYRIVGNMGDQWADILGIHAGNRTFKLPNPMYYSHS